MFDWLEDMLVDSGGVMLAKACELLANPAGSEYLDKTLVNAMGGVYDFAVSVQANVTGPVGYSLLGFFMLVSLYETVQRSHDMSGTKLLEKVGMVMISFILLKAVLDHAAVLMEGLFSLYHWINSGILAASGLRGGAASAAVDTGWLEALKESVGPGEAIMFFLICFVTLACSLVGALAANVVLIVLWVTLYIFLALAPIPLATLASEKWADVARGFLKQFGAACLQSGVVIIILKIFMVLFSSVPERMAAAAGEGNATAVVTSALVFAVALIATVASAAVYAKQAHGMAA